MNDKDKKAYVESRGRKKRSYETEVVCGVEYWGEIWVHTLKICNRERGHKGKHRTHQITRWPTKSLSKDGHKGARGVH